MRITTLILPAVMLGLAARDGAWALHPASPTPIERVAWMTGCWKLDMPGTIIEEHWMPPRGGMMLGMGRTIRHGRLVEHEFVFLNQVDDALAYEAHPSGQPTTTFRSSSPADTMVVFSDPAHDFPQQVGYRRMGPDSLLAWVEGAIDGRVRRIDFPYRRVGCGAT